MRFVFEPYQFDSRNLHLIGPDGEIALRPMTLRLLHELLKDAPNLIGHEQLLDRVWARQAVTPGVLSQSILELRRALGDSAQTPQYIETKHRLGYRFVAPVSVLNDEEEEHARDVPDRTTEPKHPVNADQPRRGLPATATAALAASLTIATLAAWWWSHGNPLDKRARAYAAERLHDGQPREPDALRWYREGVQALENQDEAGARVRLEKSLHREPTAVATQAALADALDRAGEHQRALELARSAAVGSDRLPRADQLRIRAFEAELDARLDEAIAQWQALFGLDPGDADGGFRLAAAQITAGQGKAAESTLNALDALGPALADRARIALLRARLAAARGDHRERLQQADAALASASANTVRIEALLEQAWAHLLGGNLDAARSSLAALDKALEGSQTSLALKRDLLRATMRREAGEFDASVSTFDEVAAAATTQGQRAIAANARREAAYVLALAGRPTEALARLAPLIEEHEALGDPRALASTLDVAGFAQQRAGSLDAAQAFGERALALYVGAGDRVGEAAVRNQLGTLFARAGRLDDAQTQWERALPAFEQVGDRRGMATVRSNLAAVLAGQGRAEAAREAYEHALDDFREVGAVPDIARIQFNLALQDRRAGNLDPAETRMREALASFEQMGADDFRLQAVATLAELLTMRARPAAAIELLDANPVGPQTPPQRVAALLTARARLDALQGEYESAQTRIEDAKRFRENAGLTDWVRMSELDMARVDACRGRLDQAEDRSRRLRRALLESGDTLAAMQAGVLFAAILHARGATTAAERVLDELDSALAEHPDAATALNADLVRAGMHADEHAPVLTDIVERAQAGGFEWLALRARLLIGGDEETAARAQLESIGLSTQPGPCPFLP